MDCYSFDKECMDLGSNPCASQTTVPPVEGGCSSNAAWFWGLAIVAGILVLVARGAK